MSQIELKDLKPEDFVFACKATLGGEGFKSSITTRLVDINGEPVYIHAEVDLQQIAALTGFDYLPGSHLVINFRNCEAPKAIPDGHFLKTILPWINQAGVESELPLLEDPLQVVLMAAQPSPSARDNATQRSAARGISANHTLQRA